MSSPIMNIKILQVVKTTAEWAAWEEANPTKTIDKGVVCFETTTNGEVLQKVGDGSHTFSQLPYATSPVMSGANGSVAGKSGLVPAPTASDNVRVLYGDGTWKTIPAGSDTIYRISAGTAVTDGATDKVKFEKSEDNGLNWHVLASGSADPSSPEGTDTFSLGLFATSSSGSDEVGKIKSSLLPSYVDDIIEGYYDSETTQKFYASYNDQTGEFSDEITPESGKIYVDLLTNSSYRWSGSVYVNISNPIDASTLYTLMETGSNGNYSDTSHGMVPAYGSGNSAYALRGSGWQSVKDSTSDADLSTSGTTLITERAVAHAIANLDGNLNSTSPSAGKTLTAFSQTDGKISATFGNISITKSQVSDIPSHIVSGVTYENNAIKVSTDGGTAAAIVSVTDNASATALSDSDTNLVTARSVVNAGYIKNISINGTSGTSFTNIAKSVKVNNSAAVAADASTGQVALTGLIQSLSYTNTSGQTASLTPDSNGVIDLTDVTLNCSL